jgi:hypothetical protein
MTTFLTEEPRSVPLFVAEEASKSALPPPSFRTRGRDDETQALLALESRWIRADVPLEERNGPLRGPP